MLRRSSLLYYHWPSPGLSWGCTTFRRKCLFFWKKIILMTMLMLNSRFTSYLFLVVKLMQMEMFSHRYPDTIKLYVVPNLTMFRWGLIKLEMVVNLFLIKESHEKNWASGKWNRSLKGKLQFAYQKWNRKFGLKCNPFMSFYIPRISSDGPKSLPPFFRQTSVLVVSNRIIDVVDQIVTGPKFCKAWNSADIAYLRTLIKNWP